ncbi:sensor histidine kinase [Microlunatus parietis]|uniref:histidine kinase n=1 Tax=Microlunatus parietis TaxID=682979 RepID=A0A7Y9LDU9_9ACTN|nr:sensor histidine kinase [Microlunatus parietis]NYE73185.1 signal transduction histidine kinase [Microlunatus parietis]
MGIEVMAPILGLALIAYLAAVRLPKLRWVPTRVIGGISAVGLLASAAAGPAIPLPADLLRVVGPVLLGFSIIGAGWAIGRAVRDRRAYLTRTAEELAARAVAEERLRIARDLHDIVAHHLSLITVKAGVAAHVATARPAEVPDALRVIERTSRDALDETRHLLDLLRTGSAADDLAPAPTIDRLPELVTAAGTAGVEVELAVDGLEGLPDDVGRSVYRIVQEAVTNVVRHAVTKRCRVRVDGQPHEVRVEVINDGPAKRGTPERQGHGLIGMRERVALHGGDFEARPGVDGGFMITAVLPYLPRGRLQVAG